MKSSPSSLTGQSSILVPSSKQLSRSLVLIHQLTSDFLDAWLSLARTPWQEMEPMRSPSSNTPSTSVAKLCLP